jgi:hypothetical protein
MLQNLTVSKNNTFILIFLIIIARRIYNIDLPFRLDISNDDNKTCPHNSVVLKIFHHPEMTTWKSVSIIFMI